MLPPPGPKFSGLFPARPEYIHRNILQYCFSSVNFIKTFWCNSCKRTSPRSEIHSGDFGTHETIRTSDLPLRRRLLYPAELRGHMKLFLLWGECSAGFADTNCPYAHFTRRAAVSIPLATWAYLVCLFIVPQKRGACQPLPILSFPALTQRPGWGIL